LLSLPCFPHCGFLTKSKSTVASTKEGCCVSSHRTPFHSPAPTARNDQFINVLKEESKIPYYTLTLLTKNTINNKAK